MKKKNIAIATRIIRTMRFFKTSLLKLPPSALLDYSQKKVILDVA